MKKQLLTIYNQYKHIIWPVAIGLVCVVIAIFVITPQVKSYFDTKQQISEAQNRLEILNDKNSQLNGYDENSLRNNVQVALGSLPEDQQPSLAFGTVQRVAVSSGVNLISLGFSASKGSGVAGASSFPITAQVLTSPNNLAVFLKNLSAAPVAMSVSGIQVSTSDKATLLDAKLQIDVFYASVPKELGAADNPLTKLTANEESIIFSLSKSSSISVSTSSGTVLVPRGKPGPFH